MSGARLAGLTRSVQWSVVGRAPCLVREEGVLTLTLLDVATQWCCK